MSEKKIGPKEAQLRAMRDRYGTPATPRQRALVEVITKSPQCRGHSVPFNSPPAPPAKPREAKTVKKSSTAKAPRAKKASRPKKGPAKKAAAKKVARQVGAVKASKVKARVPVEDVAKLICRPGGASMAELEKATGIKAHPMRAKIFRLKHDLGYAIENREGRYYGSAPAGAR